MANRRADPSPGGGHLSRFARTVHDDPEFILAENRMRYEAGWAHRGVGLRLDDWIVEAHMFPPLPLSALTARRRPLPRRAAGNPHSPCQTRSSSISSARPRQSTTMVAGGHGKRLAPVKHTCP